MNTDECVDCPFFKTQRNFIRGARDCSFFECTISEAVKYNCGIKAPDHDSYNLRIKLKKQDRIAFWLLLVISLPLAFLPMPIRGFLLPLVFVFVGHGFVLPGIRKIRAKKRM